MAVIVKVTEVTPGWEIRELGNKMMRYNDKNAPVNSNTLYVWFKYNLGQKYYVPQVQPELGLNSFHVTETPALTTWPSVTTLGQKHFAPQVLFIQKGLDVAQNSTMPCPTYVCLLHFKIQ